MDANEIRALRARLGLSQEEFANQVGTVQQAISFWESGNRKPGRMARKLLDQVAQEHGIRFIDEPEPTYDAG